MGIKATTGMLMDLLDGIAPFSLAETWDNSGLQAGNLSWPVSKVMISLDVSYEVMEAAEKWGANLVLSHHPLIFRPLKCIDFSSAPGNIILKAAAAKISIISVHTNFDKANYGLNDFFASLAGLDQISCLHEGNSVNLPDQADKDDMICTPGIGRTGRLDPPVTLYDFARYIKEKLDIGNLRVTGQKELIVKKAAVCTGSGGSLLDEFFQSGADVFITGDIKYHEAREIEQAGLGLIDVGHFASEHIGVALLADRLYSSASDAGIDIEIKKFNGEYDPFIII